MDVIRTFKSSRHFSFLVLALAGLTACQRYEWTHPTKSIEQFGRDKFLCESRASRLYPMMPVTVVEGGGFIYDDDYYCRPRPGRVNFCYSRPPIYVPPTYSTRDMNENSRNQAVESCLYSKGYVLVPAK